MTKGFIQTDLLAQFISSSSEVLENYDGIIPEGILIYSVDGQYFKLGIDETWADTPILFSVSDIHDIKQVANELAPRLDDVEYQFNEAIEDLISQIQDGSISADAYTLQGLSPDDFAYSSHIHEISDLTNLLDTNGKIYSHLIPSSAITDTFVVEDQDEMISLDAEIGDIAVRNDLNRTFILQHEPASEVSNWIELKTPTDLVLSVAGKTGVVDLEIADIVGLQSALNNKSNTTHGHAISKITTSYAENSMIVIDGSGSLVEILPDDVRLLIDAATSVHDHQDLYHDKQTIDTFLDGKANTSHTHSASNITTGILPLSRGGTGRSDGKSTGLVTPVTINGVSFDGTQSIIISADPNIHTHDDIYYTETEINNLLADKANTTHTHSISNVTNLQTSLDSKQAVLVSGTNIKTVQGINMLGSGNIQIIDISGNSATATKLATPRTINGVSFDGTSNITITANPNTHNHSTSDITSGILPIERGGTGRSDGKAVALVTPRTINGVAFDGSANITISADPNTHNHDDRYYTESEITSLLSGKSDVGHTHSASTLGVLSLSGGTMTGGITSFREVRSTASGTSGTISYNCTTGTCFNITPTGNITNWNFTNVPSSGQMYTLVIYIIASGTTRTIAWPSSIKWPGGTAPTIDWTNGKYTMIVLTTTSGGSTWFGDYKASY